MEVFLGADHRGFALKEKLKGWLEDRGYAVRDLGAVALDPADDYPDVAVAVSRRVNEAPGERRGILLCGSGVGMAIAANKIGGIRATVVWNRDVAIQARAHDDVNIIALAADWMSPEQVSEVVAAFLETPFSGEERHLRRIKKISDLDV